MWLVNLLLAIVLLSLFLSMLSSAPRVQARAPIGAKNARTRFQSKRFS